ncbi:hypothetical protein RIF29_23660 [Crotalaria pallida]|uniref:RNase H type-1 domain-containing protein n=1 Tax=Crotalaria pallida TaxID=3830 RepID=A0AAN9F807_CROPI
MMNMVKTVRASMTTQPRFPHGGSRVEKFFGWCYPPKGYLKLNVDGSFRRCSNKAACGGLIRDDNGAMVKAFQSNLGVCSSVKAELWGLLQGLQMAIGGNASKLIIEMDSKANPTLYSIIIRQKLLRDGFMGSLINAEIWYCVSLLLPFSSLLLALDSYVSLANL